jgi:hypothetical protein
MIDDRTEFEKGRRYGYQVGDLERITLATANSELRSKVRDLEQENMILTSRLADLEGPPF